MHKKELWAVLIVVVGATIILVYTAAHAVGQILAINASNPNVSLIVDESGWQTYDSDTYGFSVEYPPNWELSTDGLSANDPYIAIGNPLQGTSTYALDIFIENNSSSLSSAEYVHELLAVDHAQDVANASSGPAPQITPQFTKSFFTTAGVEDAYELFHVFEFDHNAEQIYVSHGNFILRFDFPLGEENANLNAPVNNNAIVHQIVNTLTFSD